MRKALVIGINEYPACELTGCVNDAKAVGNLLSKNEDGSSNFGIRYILGKTNALDLKTIIEDCFKSESDIALLYFSGHGAVRDDIGYLVTSDFCERQYGVSMQEILNCINRSKCKNKIVILDCCHSGHLGQDHTNSNASSILSEGVTLLTASRSTESSLEINGHGVFTSLLLEALSGRAADINGNITPGAIYAYIDKMLGPWDQRPVFKTNISRFVSIRNIKPLIEPSILRKIIAYFDKPSDSLKLDPSFEPTNTPSIKHEIIKPYAQDENTEIFKNLQKMVQLGLVVPEGEQHMYFAAMNAKSCKLTHAGQLYWQLVKSGRF